MKSSLLFAVGFAVAWAALTPATCRAQAEIAPDHFEMINVAPFSHPNAQAMNAKPVEIRIGHERRGNSIHNCANRKSPGNDKSKQMFATAINSCRSGASQPSKRVEAVERISKQARAEVNFPSPRGESKLPREVPQPKP